MEMLASTFIDAGKLKNMTREEMQEYDMVSFPSSTRISACTQIADAWKLLQLLTLPDWTIYYWAIGKKAPPTESFWATSKVLAELKKHASNEQKQLRKMPEISSYGVGQA